MNPATCRTPALSLMFFGATPDLAPAAYYDLVLEAARFADGAGFASLWLPERHFGGLGGFCPNPALLHAAIARNTQRLELRAGSVVAPLHDPLLMAEDWAMVDQLSGGRAGFAMASGWNPDDFALQPDSFACRQQQLEERVEAVRQLWLGQALDRRNGMGEQIGVRSFPGPLQHRFPLWITAARAPQTFTMAGRLGANVLTHLLDQGVEELAAKIASYRAARADAGHDPDGGQVTVMVHTHIAESPEAAVAAARAPFCRFLGDNLGLLRGLAASRGQQFDAGALDQSERAELSGFLFDRFRQSRAMIGGLDEAASLAHRLGAIGVDEIAALVDFGPPPQLLLTGLRQIELLARRLASSPAALPKAIEGRKRLGPFHGTGPAAGAMVVDAIVAHLGVRHGATLQLCGVERMACPAPGAVWAEIVHEQAGVDGGGRYDLALSDAAGQPCGRLDGLQLAPECAAALPAYRMTWRAYKTPQNIAPIVTYVDLFSCDMVESLQRCRATAPSDLVLLVRMPASQTAPAQFLQHATMLFEQALDLLAGAGLRLWLAVQTIDETLTSGMLQAGMAGYARARSAQLASLWGGLIWLESAAAPGEVAPLLAAASADRLYGHEWRVAVDGSVGERLLAPEQPHAAAPIRLDPEGAYLVTGASGDVGGEVVRALAAMGAREIVLVGRSLARGETCLAQLQQELGAEVGLRFHGADVGDLAAVQALRTKLDAVLAAPVRGIVHAAAPMPDLPGAETAAGSLELLRAKLDGALHLAQVFPMKQLDHFVLISSWAGTFAEVGMSLAVYAAANAACDAMALQLAASHPASRVVSLAWGDWAETAVRGRASANGVRLLPDDWTLSRAAGRTALQTHIGTARGQLLLTPVPWDAYLALFPAVANRRLLGPVAGLAEQTGSIGADHPILDRDALQALVYARMPRAADETQLWQAGLQDLGFDSIMALELRSHIERHHGATLPIALFLSNPTIAMLSAAISADGGAMAPLRVQPGLIEIEL